LDESRAYEKKYGAETAAWLMDKLYHNYKRLMMVARNSTELETYRAKALEVADFCSRWGMRYEEMLGSDKYLEQLGEIAVTLEQAGDEFLVIPPGGVVQQALFLRIADNK
jgi:membrane glycosyltransferase